MVTSPAEVVFDNSQYFLTNLYSSAFEYGDEVRLQDPERTITEFSFEYFGDFLPSGREKVRLRLYANDGPDTDERPDKYIPAPGTVLFDSGSLAIGPGFNAVSMIGLSVPVPKVFTWTVQFLGVTGTAGSKAGLLFFDPPTVGASYDDFWTNSPAGWGLRRFPGQMIANFGCRATSLADAPLVIGAPTYLPDGQAQLPISGPVSRSFALEFSTNQQDWVVLKNLTFTNRTLTYRHRDAANYSQHFYRGSMLPETLTEILSIRPQTGVGTQLVYTGPVNGLYQIEVSTNLSNWSPLVTNVFPAGFGYYTERTEAASPQRFYRLQRVASPGMREDLESSHPVNGLFQLGLAGAPGRHVVIQASSDLVNWVSLSTNMFSFTTGAITFVDAQAGQHDYRFYRAVSPSAP